MTGGVAMKANKTAGFVGSVPKESLELRAKSLELRAGVGRWREWENGRGEKNRGKGVLDVLWMFGRFGVEI